MRPLNRKPVHKGRSTRKFVHNARRTKAVNVNRNPMRGGIRL